MPQPALLMPRIPPPNPPPRSSQGFSLRWLWGEQTRCRSLFTKASLIRLIKPPPPPGPSYPRSVRLAGCGTLPVITATLLTTRFPSPITPTHPCPQEFSLRWLWDSLPLFLFYAFGVSFLGVALAIGIFRPRKQMPVDMFQVCL